MRFFLAFITAATALTGTARASEADCWRTFDTAVAHRASVTLPPYIAYQITRRITNAQIDAPGFDRIAITLRTSDGTAKINDDDFGGDMITANPSPGPPFLGPYGDRREAWLDENGLGHRAIAVVHAHSDRACTMEAGGSIDGNPVVHIVITPAHPGRPGIREVWISADNEFRRAIVAAPVGEDGKPQANGDLVPMRIDTQQIGDNVVVKSLSYATPTGYHTTYDFTGYTFPSSVTADTFGSGQ